MEKMFDKKKICIVVNINQVELADMTLKSLNKLKIPAGFTVEVCTIEAEQNIAKAYNQAIKDSDAQYKVYLREGVEILNADLLVELLALFEYDYKVGIVGVSGAEYIPVSCNINATRKKYGMVYNKKEQALINWHKPDTKAKCIAALDDWLLATQYDIEWREDLFLDGEYLNLSQCTEFKRKGYEALVVAQDNPWICIDDFFRMISLKNEVSKESFKAEYYRDVFPLVSILIQTHNRPEYLKIALESAINQTYKNLDIVVSDNSDDERTKNVMKDYLEKDDRIRYFFHRSISAVNNNNVLCDNIRGEYINWLMDDDYFALNKIEAMIDYYREYDNVSLVTSRRQPVGSNGEILDRSITSRIVIEETSLIKGEEAGKILIHSNFNYIGEPTTPLLKVSYLDKIGKSYFGYSEYENIFYRNCIQWDIGTRKLYGMGDMMLWYDLFNKGDLVYIVEDLSYFRIHDGQDQTKRRSVWVVLNFIGWFLMLHHSFARKSFVQDKENFFAILERIYKEMQAELLELPNDVDNLPEFLKCIEFAEQELAERKILDVFSLYDF